MRDILSQVDRPTRPTTDGNQTGAVTPAGRLDDQLCFALYAATNAVTRTYRPLLKAIGLTYPQYLVLLILWEYPSRQVGEIAERLQLATHAVSPILDRLEDAGLVQRSKGVGDGRVVCVELTAAGVALEAAAAAVQDEVRCRTLLEPHRVDRLRAELVELADRMHDA